MEKIQCTSFFIIIDGILNLRLFVCAKGESDAV